MPDDDEVWRRVARGLDDEARAHTYASFADAPRKTQEGIVHRFAQAELHGGVWGTMNVARAWSIVMRYVVQAFYAHPWAWNEIGFGGPAYPRGYKNPGPDKREPWEVRDQVNREPIEIGAIVENARRDQARHEGIE